MSEPHFFSISNHAQVQLTEIKPILKVLVKLLQRKRRKCFFYFQAPILNTTDTWQMVDQSVIENLD